MLSYFCSKVVFCLCEQGENIKKNRNFSRYVAVLRILSACFSFRLPKRNKRIFSWKCGHNYTV